MVRVVVDVRTLPIVSGKVFEGHGIAILKKDDGLYIRFDAGRLALEMKEVKVSEQQAARAQASEEEAHRVLLEVERDAG